MADTNTTPMAAAPKPKKNIFTSPLKEFAKGKMEKATELKKKNYRKGSLFLLIAAVFLGVYSFLFLYPQVQVYLEFDQELASLQGQIGNYEVTLEDLTTTRDFHKAAYDEEFKEELALVDVVFPETTDKLTVIRLLENFATHLAAVYPPFEFSSISFQKPQKKKGYTALSFSTNIHASKANFERFLGLVNLSGSLDPEDPDHIRLLEITNISVRYRGSDKKGKDKGVDFNVKLNAYSR